MTSNGVSNALSSMTLAKGPETGAVSQDSQGFDMLLSSKTAAKAGAGQSAGYLPPQSNGSDGALRSYEKKMSEAGYRDRNRISSYDKTGKLKTQAEEKSQELRDKVTELLAEKMGMTQEEVLEAMESMGITFENLLLGNGLADFVGQLTGAQDTTELLFHDTFQELLQQLEVIVSDFTQQTGLTSQELEAMLKQLEQAGQELPAESFSEGTGIPPTDMTQQLADEVHSEKSAEQAAQNNAAQQLTESMQNNANPGEAVTIPENKDMAGIQQLVQGDGGQEGQQGTDAQTESSFMDDLKQEDARTTKETMTQNEPIQQQITYQNVQQTTVGSAGEQIVQTLERSYVNVDDIMSQITEFTRVTVEQAQSSIEMQLNPAHLGKIYLQVVSKEGMITAQLAAQNEAVKQALESQAAVLKENMNQQGLKVEAVEVTIASHEFEQSLENDRQQTDQENGEKQGEKAQRFLSVDQLDELSGLMSEEDSLLAKIMLENGNSMDMTV